VLARANFRRRTETNRALRTPIRRSGLVDAHDGACSLAAPSLGSIALSQPSAQQTIRQTSQPLKNRMEPRWHCSREICQPCPATLDTVEHGEPGHQSICQEKVGGHALSRLLPNPRPRNSGTSKLARSYRMFRKAGQAKSCINRSKNSPWCRIRKKPLRPIN